MNSLPVAPFPTIGEIAYEISLCSGLVKTTNDKDPLYNSLKAFKDDRKRPGLAPVEFPRSVLVDLEDRLAGFWNVGEGDTSGMAVAVAFLSVRTWFDYYAGFVASRDATLLERGQMVDLVLWPTLFASGAAVFLKTFNQWQPFVDLEKLLESDNPLGYFVNFLCTNGAKDFNVICHYRAKKYPNNPIDPVNCRKTLDEWIEGSSVPNLERCQEILEALNLGAELRAKIWMLIARLLQKTPTKYRRQILIAVKVTNPVDPRERAYSLMKDIAWSIGEKLNIGPDRPYAKIREALYEVNCAVPKSRAYVVDMLVRQENTWKPIHNQTQYLIHWLWGRFYVLCGEYEEGLKRYKSAYDYGANRDPDIYNVAIHEAMVLAAFLGKKRTVERFRGWIGLYSTFEWDEDAETTLERFEKIFPTALRFPETR